MNNMRLKLYRFIENCFRRLSAYFGDLADSIGSEPMESSIQPENIFDCHALLRTEPSLDELDGDYHLEHIDIDMVRLTKV